MFYKCTNPIKHNRKTIEYGEVITQQEFDAIPEKNKQWFMKHDIDTNPMTREKKIKLKGHEYIMKFKNIGISWEKSKAAAIVLALTEKENFFRHFQGSAQDRAKHTEAFELLESGIKAY